MNLSSNLNELSLEELINQFQNPRPVEENYKLFQLMEIASLIRAKGDPGIAFLWSNIRDADAMRLRATLFALTEPTLDHPELKNILLSYLHDGRPMIVAEAVDSLRRQGEKDVLEEVLPLLRHHSPYVRGSVLRFVRQLHPDKAFSILVEALKDPDYIVRENAADELGELRAVEAIPYIRPLLVDSHPDVRQAAQTAIEILETVQDHTTQANN